MPKEFTPGSYGAAMQEEAKKILAHIEKMQELRTEGEPEEILEEDSRYAEQKREAQQSFARLLIYHRGSFNGYTSDLDTPLHSFAKRETNQKVEQMAKSEDIENMFAADNLSNVKNMILDGNNELRPVDEMVKNFEAGVKQRKQQQEQQEQQQEQQRKQQQEQQEKEAEEARLQATRKDILEKLPGTLSRSFAGRLKSFFVGNSKEYDSAFNSLKDLAEGKGDKATAEKNIRQYLTLRGKKVRDHEYGRERFEYMMKALATVSDPMKFEAFCAKIDEDRRALSKGAYKGTIVATQYMTDAQKEQLAAQKEEARIKEELETKELNDFINAPDASKGKQTTDQPENKQPDNKQMDSGEAELVAFLNS